MSAPTPLLFASVPSPNWIRLRGEDRIRFLNGQSTQDIKKLKSGHGCYTVFPNGKGKIRTDGIVFSFDDSLLVELEPGLSEKMMSELDRFLIADDVQLENETARWEAFTLVGMNSAEALASCRICPNPPKELFHWVPVTNAQGWIFRSRRSLAPSFDLRLSRDALPILAPLKDHILETGGALGDATALEALRIEAEIPRFGIDMNETHFPQEAGLESLAISFAKGCYIGQEVIARIKSVGQVHKKLVRLKLSSPIPVGTPLIFREKNVGCLTSITHIPGHSHLGLAIIHRDAASPGSLLQTPKGDAEVLPSVNE